MSMLCSSTWRYVKKNSNIVGIQIYKVEKSESL